LVGNVGLPSSRLELLSRGKEVIDLRFIVDERLP